MRQNGHGPLTFEDARTWMEETGLCLFLPRRQFAAATAPSFVEAIAGRRDETPDPAFIAEAESLLVRLENDGVAVRLNLLGQPGEQPDFVVAAWVLPYVYALRGDRDWRRSPQLTGSRQVSPLAVQAYKILETGETNISSLKHTLGREVTEAAVLRAITELWQQLRIIPLLSAPGEPARWQLLRQRFQKAIAEGASTSQVTAISVLASIYLQAVIAASMEEVEVFLAPLTARSKVREVLRGLVATRQVHTISLGHAPHFYVAGTLPEFSVAPSYLTNAIPASAYYLRHQEHEEELAEAEIVEAIAAEAELPVESEPAPSHPQRKPAPRKPAARPHFSRGSSQSTGRARDRKPAASAPKTRLAETRASGSGSTPRSSARPAASPNGSANPKSPAKSWNSRNGHSKGNGNGAKPLAKSTSATGVRKATSSARPATAQKSTRPAGAKSAAAGKRFSFSARPAKKRG